MGSLPRSARSVNCSMVYSLTSSESGMGWEMEAMMVSIMRIVLFGGRRASNLTKRAKVFEIEVL